MKTQSLLVTALLFTAVFTSCTTPPSTVEEEAAGIEVRGEAYLFDARLWQDDKPTSFRLNVYQTDSLIGLGGRGYLGKGALKGWVNADSLAVYFPSVNEFLYENVAELLSSFDCLTALPSFNLLDLFSDLPDPVEWQDLDLTVDTDEADEATVTIAPSDCDWSATLVYSREDVGWRVEDFTFDDGDKTRLEAHRRRYNDDAGLEWSHFVVSVPPDAVRIKP